MKKVYFVRHGESEGNVGGLRGHPDHPLTERGAQQATFIAKRCATLPITFLVSSTDRRARETALAISQEIGMAPEYADLFVEARAPSALRGKSRSDPAVIASQEEINKNFTIPGYHFADEENFEDLNERARKALVYLAEREEDEVLVVTHGFFMRMLAARAILGDDLNAPACQDFVRSLHMQNTGLSVFCYDASKEKPWWLWVWNDHAHLG